MCARYSNAKGKELLIKRFKAEESKISIPARYNIAPTQFASVVIQYEGVRSIELFKFGLIPWFAKDPRIGNRMINARAETIAEKPAFRSAFKKRRCLIPADGFYEWPDPPPGEKLKIPRRIHMTSDDLFAFAGIWESWKDAEDRETRSYAIITTAANTFMEEVHDRMPVILKSEEENSWLDQDIPQDTLMAMLQPRPWEGMEAYPVSRVVNSPLNDGPECVKPLLQ